MPDAPGQLVHTIELFGKLLRFYASPRPEPDFPWCSFQDFLNIAEFELGEFPQATAPLREHREEAMHELPDGTALINGFWALGVLDHCTLLGWSEGLMTMSSFEEAITVAMRVVTADLPNDQQHAYCQQARLRALRQPQKGDRRVY